jgi:predicted nuclease of predicted toxin-antitoxin system
VKLLFDANLSPKLVNRLHDLFEGSIHVFETGLARFTPDMDIWNFALAHGYIIVTADSDFVAISRERGWPPKVIHIERCAFRTNEVEQLVRRNAIRIAEFESSGAAVLTLRQNA